MTNDPRKRPLPQSRAAFTVLALVQATLIFTIALIIVPLPKIAHEFSLNPADLLLLQVAYGLPFSGLLLFGGRLTDRHNGRRMLEIGLIVFGASSVMAAFAPDFEILVGSRFLQGVGAAIAAPALMAVLRTLFPDPADFGRAMAVWGGVPFLGAILGFILSGIVTNWISWRWMFVVPVLVTAFALAKSRSLLPAGEIGSFANRPGLDPLGAILVTLGISLTSYGLIASGDYSWSSPVVYGPFLVGLALLIVFLGAERKARNPLLPLGFILDPRRMIGLAGMFLAAAASMAIEYVLTLYLQQIRGWSSLATAVSFMPFSVTMMVANRVSAPLIARFGIARAMTSGGLISALGLGLLAWVGRDTAYAAILLPGQIILAAGISLVLSGAAVQSTANVEQHQAGLAGGVMNTAMELGPTVGLTVLMAVAAAQADAVQGYAWAFGTAGAVFVLLAVAAGLLLPRKSN
ncbi:MFS transporter [Cohnella zeiphila]|uniref:MFS transporter n=1 Tax=Cohnella zeiphila TaxID=2761120 RepID=A0A7X0VUU1_9BACL|nr:MFS transporter [Cohnella zeiphila]MBB6730642.1 MFS transporter [Cohnella zeiphila]